MTTVEEIPLEDLRQLCIQAAVLSHITLEDDVNISIRLYTLFIVPVAIVGWECIKLVYALCTHTPALSDDSSHLKRRTT